jgi:hypothetical protein
MRNPILAALVLVLTLVALRGARAGAGPQHTESTCDSPVATQAVAASTAPPAIGVCRD